MVLGEVTDLDSVGEPGAVPTLYQMFGERGFARPIPAQQEGALPGGQGKRHIL